MQYGIILSNSLKGNFMKKIKNNWLNGFFRAWEMLFYFAIDGYFTKFITIEKNKCRGVQVLTGMLSTAFVSGLFLVLLSWILSTLAGGLPGAVISAFAIVLLLLWGDHAGGITAVTSLTVQKLDGRKFSEILPALETDPKEISSAPGSAIFAILIILKLAVMYVIVRSGCLHMLILILLAGAFTQAFILNSHTGSGAFLGFDKPSDRNIFYICAIVMLLAGCKFNLMSALAFFGGIFLWNYWIKEKFIKLPGGKSDAALTFYGEIATFTAGLIAFIYSAGNLSN